MVKKRKLLHVIFGVLILVASPMYTALAQDPQEPQVNITQVDSSQFPSVTVYISVTDAHGEPMGVEAERLLLLEDGQELLLDQLQGTAEAVEAVTTLLVFDVSGSMNHAEKLTTAKAAAHAFVEQMRPGDRVGLLSFNTAVNYVQPITSDQSALRSAIDTIVAEGDTAMYDAMVEAVNILATVTGRKAIIALTDGMDNRSKHVLEDVTASIGPAGLSISTVGLGDPRYHEENLTGLDVPALQTLASQAGGQYAFASDPVSLTALYERYARVMQSEYMITYTSPAGLRDGLTRKLTVTLTDAGNAAQQATYNPGGLMPEVGEPASLLFFLGALAALIALSLLPSIFGRGAALLGIGRAPIVKKRKPRIRFKD